MSKTWEEHLRELAEEGPDWELTSREDLIDKLAQLRYVLDKVASEPGLTGQSGLTATDTFSSASKRITDMITYLEEDLRSRLADANAERGRARGFLEQLPGGNLSPGQEALVRGAVAGTTIVLGPLSILAGEGAVQALNDHMGSEREKAAQEGVETVVGNLRDMPVPNPPYFPSPTGPDKQFDDGGESGPSPYGPPSGGGPVTPPRQTAPDFDVKPTGNPVIESPLFPTPTTPTTGNPGNDDVIVLQPLPGTYPTVTPTPDGPMDGGLSTLPGTGNIGGSGGGGGGGIGGGSHLGGGLGMGLAAGAGGAAAIAKAGRLGGASGVGGKLGGAGGVGGKLGGAGGIGGAGGVGGPRGGSSGGLLGKAGGVGGAGSAMGGGGASAGAAGGAAGGRGAGGGMMGGAGGAGTAAGGKKDQNKGRGLGGPIAPRLEDDEDLGPRSENAGAGGRE